MNMIFLSIRIFIIGSSRGIYVLGNVIIKVLANETRPVSLFQLGLGRVLTQPDLTQETKKTRVTRQLQILTRDWPEKNRGSFKWVVRPEDGIIWREKTRLDLWNFWPNPALISAKSLSARQVILLWLKDKEHLWQHFDCLNQCCDSSNGPIKYRLAFWDQYFMFEKCTFDFGCYFQLITLFWFGT